MSHSFLNVSKTYTVCQCVCLIFLKGWLLQCSMIPTRKRIRVRVGFIQFSFQIEATTCPSKPLLCPRCRVHKCNKATKVLLHYCDQVWRKMPACSSPPPNKSNTIYVYITLYSTQLMPLWALPTKTHTNPVLWDHGFHAKLLEIKPLGRSQGTSQPEHHLQGKYTRTTLHTSSKNVSCQEMGCLVSDFFGRLQGHRELWHHQAKGQPAGTVRKI